MEDLSDTINYLDLDDIYKTLNTIIVGYTFFKCTWIIYQNICWAIK